MQFELTRNSNPSARVTQLCSQFPESYWRERDIDGVFPHDFYRDGRSRQARRAIPEAYGGSGLGVQDAAVTMQAVGESGACMSGASSIHINVFGLMPVAVFGTDEQKQRMLPPMAKGQVKSCFGVSEPNTGLNTTRLKTRAVRQGDKYVVHGQKVWISTAQDADKILLLARTTAVQDLPSGGKSGGLKAGGDDAVLTKSITGKQCRTLRNAFTEAWHRPGAPQPLPAPLQNKLWWAHGRTRVERAKAEAFLPTPSGSWWAT